MPSSLFVIVPILLIIVVVLAATIKIVKEYERGVVFRLGRLVGPRGPGLILLVPFIERMQKIDLRTVTLDIPAQEVITRDNVTVRVNAVAYFRVLDPNAAIVNVTDYNRATSQIAQTTLRSRARPIDAGRLAVGARKDQRAAAADHRRADRAVGRQGQHRRGQGRRAAADDAARHGAPGRSRAREAGQGHSRRGRVRGQPEARRRRRRSSTRIRSRIQLRYLQTLTEIGAEKNTTVVFPLPIDLIAGLFQRHNGTEPAPIANTSDTTPE